MNRRQLLDIQETVSLYSHKGVSILKEKAWVLKGRADKEGIEYILKVLDNMVERLSGVVLKLEEEYEEATKAFNKGDMITADWQQYELGHELAETINAFKEDLASVWRRWFAGHEWGDLNPDTWIRAAYETAFELPRVCLRFSKAIRRIVGRAKDDRYTKELGGELLDDFR